MQTETLKAFAKYRIVLTRVLAGVCLFFIIFSHYSWRPESVINYVFDLAGLLFICMGTLGRLWASAYISGNKTNTIITEGPYSIVRHPLYLFSFLGAVGIGLASQNLLVLGLIIILFIFYYPFVMLYEERRLLAQHGLEYKKYMETVPRFLPKFNQLHEPAIFPVHMIKYRKAFLDVFWFIVIYIILQLIEILHMRGVLPILFRFP